MKRVLLAGSLLAVALALAVACASPDSEARVDPVGPDRATFDPVSHVLSRSCGTLDCHGSEKRNLRIYGFGGRRLDVNGQEVAPDDKSVSGERPTPSENDANYQAVIGLEPEIMREVVLDERDPSALTLVRKARNTEAHKGGFAAPTGSPSDLCLTSWLRGGPVDVAACAEGAKLPNAPK